MIGECLSDNCSFGLVDAVPGHKYEWKIKLFEDTDMVNIGVVELTKENKWKDGWWGTKFGYSYFETGCIFHDNQYDEEYGDEFSDGDVVEVYLDLKNQMALSFGINGNKFAKAYNVDGEKIHKLAVSRYQGNLEIVSFKVTQ